MRVELVFVLFLVAGCFASCNNDCSGNGECINESCSCYEDWAGDDCSLPYFPLENDQSSSHVIHDWVYFYTSVPDGAVSLNYEMEDNLLGDCDVYVKYQAFPSKTDHDYSNNGWSSHSSIHIDSPNPGEWIAGVYNFFDCSFTITAHIEEQDECPNDCSGFGECGADNICICDDLHYGDDCSNVILELVNHIHLTGFVAEGEWNYYYFDVSQIDAIIPEFTLIVVDTEAENADSDLYVQFNELPSLWDFEYRNAVSIYSYSLTIGSPVSGRYYVGIYGYGEAGTEYDITVYAPPGSTGECEGRCSGHGYCSSSSECVCTSEFEGDHCQIMERDLTEGESVQGYAAHNQWNYYSVVAGSSNNLVITVDQDWNDSGDCNLYVLPDEYPDRGNYQFRDIGFDVSFSIVIENPLDTHWMIGVYGYHECNYFINSAIVSNSCPNDCSDHGNCENGRCICDGGYSGDDCGSNLQEISSTEVLQGSLSNNEWHFYSYIAPSTRTSVTIVMGEDATMGYIELYVEEGRIPDRTRSDYSDTTLSNVHTIYFQYDGTEDTDPTFYIGVYGSNLIPYGESAPYSLFVYSPPI